MNILYLHGLNSPLSPEKRTILEKYGKVFSPAIDYHTESNSIALIVEQFKNEKIDVIMGSSMGGFMGYYISDAYEKPALLFNPALANRSVYQKVPAHKSPYLSYKQIVLGSKDDVVDPRETLMFLSKMLQEHTNYHIHIRQDLMHRIPVNIFEEEVKTFFKTI